MPDQIENTHSPDRSQRGGWEPSLVGYRGASRMLALLVERAGIRVVLRPIGSARTVRMAGASSQVNILRGLGEPRERHLAVCPPTCTSSLD